MGRTYTELYQKTGISLYEMSSDSGSGSGSSFYCPASGMDYPGAVRWYAEISSQVEIRFLSIVITRQMSLAFKPIRQVCLIQASRPPRSIDLYWQRLIPAPDTLGHPTNFPLLGPGPNPWQVTTPSVINPNLAQPSANRSDRGVNNFELLLLDACESVLVYWCYTSSRKLIVAVAKQYPGRYIELLGDRCKPTSTPWRWDTSSANRPCYAGIRTF